MIWRDGTLPDGAPGFAASLTEDLLDHGYGVLAQALRLRELGGSPADVEHALRVAAESIESAVRRGVADDQRDFHLVVAASAFHLAHYAARAFCLVPLPEARPNLSTPELALVLLMRRALRPLRELCARWLRDAAHQDELLATRVEEEGSEALDDIERIAITANFIRSLAMFLTALERGDLVLANNATDGLAQGAAAAGDCRHIPLWWGNTLARHMTDDLWSNSVHQRLPLFIEGPVGDRWAALRRRYIDVLRSRPAAEIDLWPSQWEAARRCVDPTDDLVVALPTSAGKTRIAELCILRTLADRRRVIYVTPLRALSAQLERTLARTFRPLGYSVTALYGASGVAAADVATLRDADIVVATPEKLDFALRVDPVVLDDVGLVVLDEGHMIGLGTREIRYEVLVQRLLRRPDAGARRIVCLSAIFSAGSDDDKKDGVTELNGARAFHDFTAWIRGDSPGNPVASAWRPTRQRSGILRWGEAGGRLELTVDEETPYVPGFVRLEAPRGKRKRSFPKNDTEFVLAAAKAFLADDHRVLIYCPQRRSVETLGEELLVLVRQGYFPSLRSPEVDLSRALRVGREWLGEDHVALRALQHGVALHHGALPRAFLTEIEDLLQRRALPLVIASPTLAQGIDLSCSVLIFRSIYRRGDEVISPEEFANVVGRAGRAYVDLDGITVFPVFDMGWQGGLRVARYRQLVHESASRRLESGLVMLVEMLIDLLSEGLGVARTALRDYVLDVGSTWDVQVFATAIGDTQDIELVAPVLAELDAALLGSIEDLACAPEVIADALDSAFRASLWVRRLARRDASEAQLYRDVILGRAQWMWARTTPAARRGYHAAGIGYATGKFLDEQQEALISLLRASEASVSSGDSDAASGSIIELAQRLSRVPPFAFERAIPDWERVLAAWIRGEPMGGSTSRGDLEGAIAFVQNDVVYRLVWGVEAIRVHAVQTGVAGAELLSGIVAAVLTYGVPTATGVVLAQAGLSSRSMIMQVLTAFPATFLSSDGIPGWLAAHQGASEAPGFWSDAATAAIWRVFLQRWTGGGARSWSDRRVEVDVLWTTDESVPPADATVSLVHDSADGVTYVCGADLTPLGRLVVPLADERGAVVARVSDGTGRLVIDTFGP